MKILEKKEIVLGSNEVEGFEELQDGGLKIFLTEQGSKNFAMILPEDD